MPSGNTHRLLKRQLKKYFGNAFQIPEQWRSFIEAVNSAYYESDADRNMLERSLELSSQELLQANSEMKAIFEAVPDIFLRIDATGIILDCKAGAGADLLLPRSGLLGKTITDIPLVSVAGKFRKAFEEVRKTKATLNFEYFLLRGKTETYYEARFIPLPEEQYIVIIRNITNRKEAERALKKSEEIHGKLVNAIPDIVVRTDLEGKILFINDATPLITGYQRNELEGHNIINFIAPEDREQVLQNRLLLLKGRLKSREYRLLMKDGRKVLFDVEGDVLREEDGTPFGIVNLCRDITERKRSEEQIRQNEKRFRLITDNIQDTVWLMDMNLKVTWISPSVEKMRGYSLEELRNLPMDKQMTPSSVEVAMDLIGRHLTPENLNNPQKEISAKAELAFYHKSGDIFWADTLFTLLRNKLGHPVWILGISRDITERRMMEEALRQSEKQYRLLTEKMTDIVWIADMNLRTVYVTPSVQTILGFTQEERIRQPIEQQFPPDSLAYGLKALEREMELEKQGNADPGRVSTLELEYYHKDGSTRWMETTISALRDEKGVLTGIHGVSRDITEQKRAQEELRKSENKFRLLAERISDIVWTADMNLKEQYVSPSIERVLGFTPEERLRQPLDQQMTPASLLYASETLARELALEKQGIADPQRKVRLELEYYHKDGSTRWMETMVTGIRDEHGALVELYGVSRDITERRQMEEALRQSEEKYRLIAENTGELITVTDMNFRFTYISPSITRTHGYTVDEAMKLSLDHFMTPQSMQMLLEAYEEEMALEATGIADPDRIRVLEVEEYRKDGSLIWLESSISSLRNRNNEPIGILTVNRDITERRHSQEALRRAHAELEQRVSERTYELTAANQNLQELFSRQEINIDLAKNILSMINYRPNRHTLLPGNTELFFTAYYMPCYAEGGDHYFIKNFTGRHPDLSKTAVSLKDQSGHEVGCILRSIITDLIHNALLVQNPDLPIGETISRLNFEICGLPFFGQDNFFTAIDAEIHHQNLKMRYVSSGHPPFLFIRDTDIVCLPPLESDARNLPVGIFRSIDFASGEIQLQQGDKMIFYTDGLTDLPHMSGKPVLNAGHLKDMLAAILHEEPHAPVSLLIARMFNRISGRKEDRLTPPPSVYDDITLMGLELESGQCRYEDMVRPANLEDLDDCVNHLFHKIHEEWKSQGFELPQTTLRMALEEAMVNAWKHGNREDPQKKIIVRRRYGNDAVLEILDEGNGFDFKTIYDPTCRENLLKPRGRGNFIMRLLTEDMQWKDQGRHLILYFSREAKSDQTVSPGFNLWRRFGKD